MKFALLNPNWDFKGSTYFGCQEPHTPLELLFAADQLHLAGHESLVIDAQTDNLSFGRSAPISSMHSRLTFWWFRLRLRIFSGAVRRRSCAFPWNGLPAYGAKRSK